MGLRICLRKSCLPGKSYYVRQAWLDSLKQINRLPILYGLHRLEGLIYQDCLKNRNKHKLSMSTLVSRSSRRGIVEKDFSFESCKKVFLVFSIVI